MARSPEGVKFIGSSMKSPRGAPLELECGHLALLSLFGSLHQLWINMENST